METMNCPEINKICLLQNTPQTAQLVALLSCKPNHCHILKHLFSTSAHSSTVPLKHTANLPLSRALSMRQVKEHPQEAATEQGHSKVGEVQ